ncbi:MAG: methylated-DNA--[protein]-cysteine S-methyltransferase [Bacteroidetes bacterium]|nr:MAG: methylated-DNA--[protein]-cysteine S-methyltransferase [Bacteroidota bacterium]
MKSLPRAFLKTAIGFIEITGSGKGVRSLYFLDFKVRVPRVPHELKDAVDQLHEYFIGERKEFNLDLDLEGSAFQLKVWNELLKIPYGKTITYHELARRIGNADSFRAVGGANATNPVSVIIPCHRVLGTNGRLVGYAGGLKRKKWLLEHEHAFAQRDLFYR